MKKAWLITWDWDGEHASVENPFVGIFSARRSRKQVSFFIENYYLFHTSMAREAAYYANRERPYRAEPHINDGITHEEMLTCGANPFIYARQVTELEIVYLREEEIEVLTWQEPGLSTWAKEAGKKRMVMQAGERKELCRTL